MASLDQPHLKSVKIFTESSVKYENIANLFDNSTLVLDNLATSTDIVNEALEIAFVLNKAADDTTVLIAVHLTGLSSPNETF